MTHKHNSTIYYPQWTSCHTVFDGKDMAYLFFDLGLHRIIPVPGNDNTLQILVNYTSRNENGLPQEVSRCHSRYFGGSFVGGTTRQSNY